MIDTNLLMGVWRLAILSYPNSGDTHYDEKSNWTECRFAADGRLSMFYQLNGHLSPSGAPSRWAVEADKIIVYQFGREWYEIMELTQDTLQMKFLKANVFCYYKKVV